MYCAKCGAGMAAAAKFCPKCGAPAVKPAAPGPVRAVPARPAAEKSDAVPERKTAPGKRRMAVGSDLWIFIVLLIAALIAAFGALSVCFWAQNRTAPDQDMLENQEASLVELVAEGNAAYSLKDYDLALDFYEEALERFPQEPDVMCRLADVCYQLDDTDKALSHYQMALMLYETQEDMPVVSAQNYFRLTED